MSLSAHTRTFAAKSPLCGRNPPMLAATAVTDEAAPPAGNGSGRASAGRFRWYLGSGERGAVNHLAPERFASDVEATHLYVIRC